VSSETDLEPAYSNTPCKQIQPLSRINTLNGQRICRISPVGKEQDAQLSQRDRAAGCVIVFAKSRRLKLGDNILRTV